MTSEYDLAQYDRINAEHNRGGAVQDAVALRSITLFETGSRDMQLSAGFAIEALAIDNFTNGYLRIEMGAYSRIVKPMHHGVRINVVGMSTIMIVASAYTDVMTVVIGAAPAPDPTVKYYVTAFNRRFCCEDNGELIVP